jgi:hypothetical protein
MWQQLVIQKPAAKASQQKVQQALGHQKPLDGHNFDKDYTVGWIHNRAAELDQTESTLGMAWSRKPCIIPGSTKKSIKTILKKLILKEMIIQIHNAFMDLMK